MNTNFSSHIDEHPSCVTCKITIAITEWVSVVVFDLIEDGAMETCLCCNYSVSIQFSIRVGGALNVVTL